MRIKGNTVNCWRRKTIVLSECRQNTEYDTWVKDAPSPPSPSPTPPSGPFPTNVPAFMKAFVEGLLSDHGTDAKKCESNVKEFAVDMENLALTSVGATKAIVAAIEAAKDTCTPVANDALLLATSALNVLFHPGRVAQNYKDSRTEILSQIGSALEDLAKKDFKGAGKNVGMMNRRLIEGPVAADVFRNVDQQVQGQDDSNKTADTVASIAVYSTTYWGAAALTQDNLASTSAENWGDFLEGLLEGLMSDGTDLSDCTGSFALVGQAVKSAKEKIGMSLSTTMAAAATAKRSCATVAGDVGKLAVAAFNDLLHPDNVFKNFQDLKFDIEMDLGKAFESLARNDYSTSGNLMGMAIRRVIEGGGMQNRVVVV